MSGFSDYIVYFDESGSPNLEADSTDFPIFVLTSICVKKDTYINEVVPALQSFKFKYFGHDQTILHEREIRRQSGAFAFLQTDVKLYEKFLNDISELIEACDFTISASVVHKTRLKDMYPNPFNPYNIALLQTMEHLALTFRENGQLGKKIFLIAESRNKKENDDLELVFRQIIAGDIHMKSYQASLFKKFQWHILFSDKKSNSAGLQLADLIARPIGNKHLHPDQQNRAFDIIEKKVDWWIKTFP